MHTMVATAVLLALAAGQAAAAHYQPTLLASWLPKERASVQTSPEYYHGKDVASSCLRLTSVDSCDIIGLLAGSYFETSVDCCKGSYYSEGDQAFNPVELGNKVGKCAWRYEVFLGRFGDIFTEPTRVGTYSVQCDLYHGAEECGEGMCDDMILESEGPLYSVPDAAIKGPIPDLVFADNACRDLANGALRGSNDTIGGYPIPDYSLLLPKNPTKDAAKVATASANYGDHEEPALYYPGTALVVNGPVRVSSRHGQIKYDTGYLQAVTQVIPDGGRPIVPSHDQFIADAYRIDLKLKKDGYKY